MSAPLPYLICATPRSGSTLLCDALQQTGIVGNPTEYFLTRIKDACRELWEDNCPFSFAARLLEYEATPNGAFGAKVMYPCLDTFITDLRHHSEVDNESEAQLIQKTFPGIRWIFIERRDRIRQAISLVKSVRTGIWHRVEGEQMRSGVESGPRGNFGVTHIERTLHQINALYESWESFFSRNNLSPYRVYYEDLANDYVSNVSKILAFIGPENDKPITIQPARTEKLADAVTEKWVDTFRKRRRWLPIYKLVEGIKTFSRMTLSKFSEISEAASAEPQDQESRESLGVIQDFENLLRFNPGSIVARTVLGIHHERLNQLDQARAYYREALAQDPGFTPAANRISRLSTKSK